MRCVSVTVSICNNPTVVVISDDLTGALDTGVQFFSRGATVTVLTPFRLGAQSAEADVLVIDAETRHCSPDQTYETTLSLAKWAAEQKVPYLYIKTDSGLRGHIGMALKAALDAAGCRLAAFAPAYPDMDRITRGGQQLIGGVPIQDSVFSRDVYDPVRASHIRDMIVPCGLAAVECARNRPYETRTETPAVAIFDVEENVDFGRITQHLSAHGQLRVTAGCAAFAAALHPALGLPEKRQLPPSITGPLLVICGSLNPITRSQMEYGEQLGYTRLTYALPKMLEEDYLAAPEGRVWLESIHTLLRKRATVLLDTGLTPPKADAMDASPVLAEDFRNRITRQLGRLTLRLLEMEETRAYTPMIIGGDTLMGFLDQANRPDILLEGEVTAGVVAFTVEVNGKAVRMLSKSGGFGKRTLLKDIIANGECAG